MASARLHAETPGGSSRSPFFSVSEHLSSIPHGRRSRAITIALVRICRRSTLRKFSDPPKPGLDRSRRGGRTWMPFTAALLILWAPGGFRFTCYYYRGAYYKAFWADPPACAVGEPRKSYCGEQSFPLIFQNVHRYFLYLALAFIVLLLAHDVYSGDAVLRWPSASASARWCC